MEKYIGYRYTHRLLKKKNKAISVIKKPREKGFLATTIINVLRYFESLQA